MKKKAAPGRTASSLGMPAPDRISIRDLEIRGILGVYPAERARKRVIRLQIDLWGDFGRAGNTDDLADTVDYAAVAARATEVTLRIKAHLAEYLAEQVAGAILAFPGVTRVWVQVDKPKPVPGIGNFTFAIVRDRSDNAP